MKKILLVALALLVLTLFFARTVLELAGVL